ncbi:MAG: histidinol-phosphate transaminase [Solirubrobacterales bacterium]
MSITFAQKLARMPNYEAGLPSADASERYGVAEITKLASNESPYPPNPAVIEAVTKQIAGVNRYPDPASKVLRRRLADRHETDPARIAVGNGSCEILLAAAEALCEPGAEIVYAWPAFSMYPHLAALTGAREIRVPLAEGDVHDLDAMLVALTAATQLLIVCNPNNPTGTHVPAAEVGAFLERVPKHVIVILDEAYIDFQTNDDPDESTDLLKQFPNLVCLRTFSKSYALAGLRVGYALCSPQFRSAVDAVRQPFSLNALAQAAAAEALLHADDLADRVERTIVERVVVEEGVRELGLETAESQANFSWISLGERDEQELIDGLGSRGVIVRGGAALGGPGHIRVTHGHRAENERFLEALSEVL